MKRRIVGCLALVAFVGTLGLGEVPDSMPYPVAGLDELVNYSLDLDPDEPELYSFILPGTRLAVLLRPISESEFGSYQVQAVAIEIVEAQMLAASLVLPVATGSDVLVFPEEVRRVLQRVVNEISGFAVFPDVPLPD